MLNFAGCDESGEPKGAEYLRGLILYEKGSDLPERSDSFREGISAGSDGSGSDEDARRQSVSFGQSCGGDSFAGESIWDRRKQMNVDPQYVLETLLPRYRSRFDDRLLGTPLLQAQYVLSYPTLRRRICSRAGCCFAFQASPAGCGEKATRRALELEGGICLQLSLLLGQIALARNDLHEGAVAVHHGAGTKHPHAWDGLRTVGRRLSPQRRLYQCTKNPWIAPRSSWNRH